MAILQSILDFINNNLMSSIAIIGIIVEFVLRLFPTVKPAGIFQSISSVLKILAQIFAKVAEFLDKILPQNIVPPSA